MERGNWKDWIKRYLVFLIGLLLNSFGVAFVTNADLGASPIAAIPYSLSMILPQLTLGNWVILFNITLIVIQAIIQGKNANKAQLGLEVVIAFCFGYGVDLAMFCLQALHPAHYPLKLISMIAGCMIIALGAYLEVLADVAMLPGDAFVNAIAKGLRRQYGGVRVISDISMSVVAGILCILFLHELSGVREGTILSALLVGNMVKIFAKLLASPTAHLLPPRTVHSAEQGNE